MGIQKLAAEVAAKIAAGEVIERPASVVKELIENAIDAGASQIGIELGEGGVALVKVVDNGRGIPAAELPLAFERHATSKLVTLADLEQVRTLGFRGEALASIAAVATVTITSRPASQTAGAQLTVDNGVFGRQSSCGCSTGTIITVRGLFASVPARLKFLKNAHSETARCLYLLHQYALANPQIKFTLTSERRSLFATSGNGRLADVIVQVYGFEAAQQMAPVSGQDERALEEEEALLGRLSVLTVQGYVSLPSYYKTSRTALSFFVNGRWIQSRMLGYAVEEAYQSLLLTGRHPVAVLGLEIEPDLMDVNVHPTKAEVRFLQERRVFAAVQRAVRAALLAATQPVVIQGETQSSAAETADPPVAEFEQPSSIPSTNRAGATLWSQVGPTREPSSSQPRPVARIPGQAAAPNTGLNGRLPVLRVLGQVSLSYIITEGPEGVYLIDQHAAHERILFEQIQEQWHARSVAAQLLLEPLAIELEPAQQAAIEAKLPLLAELGFELEQFGPTTLLLRAVPSILAGHGGGKTSAQAVHELMAQLATDAGSEETWQERVLANVACKAAIKANHPLSLEEMRALIQQLEQTDYRHSCSHGRPTMVYLSLSQLEREFARR